MRQSLPRVPKDRIAVLIGAKGATRRDLEKAAGCKNIQIDSISGEIEVTWPEAGDYDPVKALKLPTPGIRRCDIFSISAISLIIIGSQPISSTELNSDCKLPIEISKMPIFFTFFHDTINQNPMFFLNTHLS